MAASSTRRRRTGTRTLHVALTGAVCLALVMFLFGAHAWLAALPLFCGLLWVRSAPGRRASVRSARRAGRAGRDLLTR
ncbi:hypothetical protein [Cellulosimicrobium cellulans]|uniref:hypothetical protein n=1 Tax=Cellulosimicrobium cellulans TaxID=1710 RepID=UPI00382D95E5